VKRLFRLSNAVNWPIWLKLSAAFFIAIAFPAALILLLVQSSFNTVSRQNILTNVTNRSKAEVDTISATFNQVQSTLVNFAATSEYNRQMTRVLAPDGNTDANALDLALTLQSLLIGSENFSQFTLLNKEGVSLVDVTASTVLEAGKDETGNPAFQQATASLVQNHDQSVSVYDPSTPMIELTIAVRDGQGNAVGFLIGGVNVQRLIEKGLTAPDTNFPLYSYLITLGQNPVLLTRSEWTEQATASFKSHSVGIERALRGGVGSDLYRIGPAHDMEVAAYFAAIKNPTNANAILFALISELPTSAVPTPTPEYLVEGQPFVIGIGLLILLVVIVILLNQLITPPLSLLRSAIQSVAEGKFDEPLPSAERGDEIGAVSAAFVDMRTHVRNLLNDLQSRVAARTRDINATHEISRFAATQRDLQILMDQVVQLIVEQFPNIYHAQIFLLDQDRVYAVLRSSTGQAGKALLERGHRLAAGSISLVGQAVEQGRTVIARDTASSQIWRPNELLPETRAELSIPLRVGEQTIGVMDVQSKYSNAFTEDEINILQTMSDQIALAIENARLYQESVRRLEEIEQVNRRATLQTWQEYVFSQREREISSQAGVATGSDLSELRRRAIALGKVVIGEETDHNTVPVAVPIVLRGQTLGAVEWELPAYDVNSNKLQLAQELANRLAVSLDNARLFQESQRSAERERIVNSIAAKLTPQTEISEILQTAVREVGQALRAPQVSIRLHRPGQANGSSVDYQNGNS
jgi:GAF domain-containing protein/HAMP domain-containing protein